jgi:hypothetical protein
LCEVDANEATACLDERIFALPSDATSERPAGWAFLQQRAGLHEKGVD